MQSRLRRVVVVSVIALGVAASWSIGLADDDEKKRKREQLVSEINKHLESMAYALRGVASSSSGESSIDQSRSEAEYVKSKASSLRDVAGDDDTARRMSSYYADYADRFREAASYLRQMKTGQRALDELPRACEDKDRELLDRVKRYVERNDPKGTEEIPRLAQELGRPFADRLADADRKRSDMQSWRDRAKYFSDSDGKWSDVRNNLRDSADQVYEHFNSHWERSRKACNDLSKQDKHPAVEQALRQLVQGEKGRQDLYQDLDRKLDEITKTLNDVARDTSLSDVDRAASLANDLQSAIDRLAYVKGEDRKAGEMANNWPRYNSTYRETVRHLRILKEGQFRVDPAPAKCTGMKERLEALIKQYDRDPNGIDDIEKLAREYASTLATSFSNASNEDSKMQSARSTISGFSLSEGKWRDVSDAMKRTSEAVYAYWQTALKNAHTACDALALGERNPRVQEAIKALGEHATSTIKTYESEVAAWRERVRVYKRRDCDEMTRLWEALCGPLDYEPNEEEDKAAAWALSDQIVAGLLPGVATLLSEYDAIKRRGEELQKKAKTRDDATRILASLVEDFQKLEKLQLKTGWRGSNNPLVQFYISYGVQQHKRMEGSSSYSCDARDVSFGTNKRPDCVSAAHCTIFEFKPNNSTAISAGNSKLSSIYLPQVTAYYQKHLDDRTVPDNDHGGTEVMRRLASKCLRNGKIELTGRVETYERCERKYDCTQ